MAYCARAICDTEFVYQELNRIRKALKENGFPVRPINLIKDREVNYRHEPKMEKSPKSKVILPHVAGLGKEARELREFLNFQLRFKRAPNMCSMIGSEQAKISSDGHMDIIYEFKCDFSACYRVDCLVTSAGGIEEDLIKCLAPTYLGDFRLDGAQLRKEGLNRIGNLLIPNNNYCLFENWVLPLLDEALKEQKKNNFSWTPHKLIHRLGEKIGNEESVLYWAARNAIPVFCPGLTDGSLGDMLYFHSYRNPGLKLDIIEDVRLLNNMAVHSFKTGMIVLGGGLVKHHIYNANLMRNGADFSVLISTAQEFDGSDAGAEPDEAVSWGKINANSNPVKVVCDATIAFPLLVSQSFYPAWLKSKTTNS